MLVHINFENGKSAYIYEQDTETNVHGDVEVVFEEREYKNDQWDTKQISIYMSEEQALLYARTIESYVKYAKENNVRWIESHKDD